MGISPRWRSDDPTQTGTSSVLPGPYDSENADRVDRKRSTTGRYDNVFGLTLSAMRSAEPLLLLTPRRTAEKAASATCRYAWSKVWIACQTAASSRKVDW